jgi:hypothetical protein
VIRSILAGTASDVREHWALALRAVALGWSALLFLSLVSATLPASGTISVIAVGPQTALGMVAPRAWAMWWVRHVIILYGWSRWAYLLVQCIAAAGSGWIVARLHRRHESAALLTYVFTFLLLSAPEAYRLGGDTVSNARFAAYFSTYMLSVMLASLSILLGGLAARPHDWRELGDGVASSA